MCFYDDPTNWITSTTFIINNVFYRSRILGQALCGLVKNPSVGQICHIEKRKGYFLKRFLVPFHRLEKELPVWHKDKKQPCKKIAFSIFSVYLKLFHYSDLGFHIHGFAINSTYPAIFFF